jgi:hypothetical protein
MSVNPSEFKALLAAIDETLRHFPARPTEAGFDQEVYDELRRVRETLLRGGRDQHDPNLKQDQPPASL